MVSTKDDTLLQTGPLVFEWTKSLFGINICEDIWFPRPESYRAAGADGLIVLNASPFQTNRHERKQKLGSMVSSLNLPALFCNVVGGQDEWSLMGVVCT